MIGSQFFFNKSINKFSTGNNFSQISFISDIVKKFAPEVEEH